MAAKNTKQRSRSLLLRARAARSGNQTALPSGGAATEEPAGELLNVTSVPGRNRAGAGLQAVADRLRARLNASAPPAAAAASFSGDKVDITRPEFRGRQPKGTPQVINRQPRAAQKPEGRPSSAFLEFAAASQKEKPVGMAKAAPAPATAAAPAQKPEGRPSSAFLEFAAASQKEKPVGMAKAAPAPAPAKAAAPMPTGTPAPDATLSDGRRFWRTQESPKPPEPTNFWRTPEAKAAAVAAAARATPPAQPAPTAAEKPGPPLSPGTAPEATPVAAKPAPAPVTAAKPALAAAAKPAPAAPAKPARTGKEINWYNADTKSNEFSVPPSELQEVGIRGGAEGGTSIPIYAKVYDNPQQKEAARQREAQRQAQALMAYRARQARISPDALGTGMLQRMRQSDTVNRARR